MDLTSQKKGQVELLTAGVIALVMAGFLLVMGLIMMDELMVNTADTLTTVTNETESSVSNVTVETCANTGACGLNSFTITNMTNGTGAYVIQSTNYEVVNARDCTWRFTTTGVANATINNTAVNVTYTYKTSTGEACLGANESIGGLGRFGDYVDLLVVAIVIAIVISLIILIMSVNRVR